MIDEAQMRDIHRIVAAEIDSARKELETHGHVTPRFLFLSQKQDGSLELRYLYAPAYAETPPGRARDPFGDLLRLYAEECKAIAYLAVMEVWYLTGTKNKPPQSDRLDWSTHPDRKEAVVAMLETSAGVTEMRMDILRKPGRPPTFATGATWELEDSASGRLIGILPGART